MMTGFFFLMVVGVVSGAAIGLQGPMASIITQKLGVLERVVIVHLGGVFAGLIPLIFIQRGGNLGNWKELPGYVLFAGALGLVVLSSISFLIPKLGVAPAMMLIILGQILIGAVLDHFGLLGAAVRPISAERLAGFGVMFLGVWLTTK
jgi:transporter family-2 protein